MSGIDGRVLHTFHTGHQVNTVCPTPEQYNQCAQDGFYSKSPTKIINSSPGSGNHDSPKNSVFFIDNIFKHHECFASLEITCDRQESVVLLKFKSRKLILSLSLAGPNRYQSFLVSLNFIDLRFRRVLPDFAFWKF